MGSAYSGLSTRQRNQARRIARDIRSGRIGFREGNRALAAFGLRETRNPRSRR